MLINFKGNFINISELWFESPEVLRPEAKAQNADLLIFHQSNSELAVSKGSPFCTLITDLKPEEQEIWKSISKNAHKRINKITSETQVDYQIFENPNLTTTQEFLNFFNEFADLKKLNRIGPKRFLAHQTANSIILSRTLDTKLQKAITWHCYVTSKNRARLLYSASIRLDKNLEISAKDRDMIGNINCWHHWKDILAIKNLGKEIYDWGGYAANPKSKAEEGINYFKGRFSEIKEISHSGEIPVSWKGALYIKIRRALKK